MAGSSVNFMLSWTEHEKGFVTMGPDSARWTEDINLDHTDFPFWQMTLQNVFFFNAAMKSELDMPFKLSLGETLTKSVSQ